MKNKPSSTNKTLKKNLTQNSDWDYPSPTVMFLIIFDDKGQDIRIVILVEIKAIIKLYFNKYLLKKLDIYYDYELPVQQVKFLLLFKG